MSVIDNFERKGLFRFTRFLGLFIVCVLIVTFAVGAAVFTGSLISRSDTHVKAEAVVNELQPSAQTPATDGAASEAETPTNALSGVKLPFELQQYFSNAKNRRILLAHTEELNQSEKQDYVNNLAEIAQAAKASNINVYDAMSSYFRLKDQQISRAAAKKTAQVQTRLYIAGGAVSILGLIGLFSLILVLLAIERNTRLAPSKAVGVELEVAK